MSLLIQKFKKIPFYKSAKVIIFTFASLIALFITITSYVYYIDIKDMSWCHDNPLLLLIVFLSACLLINVLSCFVVHSKNPRQCNHILFSVIFLLIMIAGVWWIANAQSLAQNDALSLYEIAMRIIKDQDYSMITPQNSYLSLWPFQSGLLLYYELILRIIPNYNVVPMECLNWCYLGLGLISFYFLMRKWFPEERVITCWSILLLLCWPWFFYVNFAYGEMPSICLMVFSTWMLTNYLEHHKWQYFILALLSTGLGILLRKNLVIFVIATILILAVLCFQSFRKEYLFTIIGLIAVTAFFSTFPQKLYELRANNTMGSGVSAYGYIAMGLQHSEGISPGWNNGYHSTTLIENRFDTEAANEISKQSIRDSLSYMWQHPDYACSFFFQKLVPEWCDANYSCLYSTSLVFYNRTDAAWKIYDGKWTNSILQIMNAYQSILYSGFLLFCIQPVIRRLRKKHFKQKTDMSWMSLWQLTWIVTIIGGFIFYMLWEGGSRYTLPYMVCMLPYAAVGISHFNPIFFHPSHSCKPDE